MMRNKGIEVLLAAALAAGTLWLQPLSFTTAVARAAGGPAAAAAPGTEAARAALVEQVRAAEVAFARSMADRKIDAFEACLADEALFFGGGVLRGKAAVVAGWKRFFEGDKAPFSWEPITVEVLDSGTLALSSGPVHDPDGKVIGTFNSIWRREAGGRWKVLFDKGCPVCGETK